MKSFQIQIGVSDLKITFETHVFKDTGCSLSEGSATDSYGPYTEKCGWRLV